MAAFTAIDDPSAYFKVQRYTGNGASNSITFDDTATTMQPNLVWLKGLLGDTDFQTFVFDSVRGVEKYLEASSNYVNQTGTETLTAFGSDGFTIGTMYGVNASTKAFVSWSWIESATVGLDIVSYTGNGTDDTDISHNLSAVPRLILVKNLDANDAWQVYHGANTTAPETEYLVLNETAATVDAADRWSDEAPTSSVFTLGNAAEVNTNTEAYLAYCFAPVQGFSKFGSYEGNGNADGTFVYTGFRPAFIMTKSTDSTSDWQIFDSKREGFNVANYETVANTYQVQSTTARIDILSNGFKFRTASDPNVAETYVYVAFAEAPLVNSNGVPCTAR